MARQPKKPPLVAGLEIAALITSSALQLVIPPAVGLYVDRRWDVEPWGLVIGLFLGFASFLTSLRHLLRRLTPNDDRGQDR